MATSTADHRIQAAIDGAMAWERSQVGRATGDSTWAIAYPGWVGSGNAWCGGFQVAAFKQVGIDLMRCAWWFYTPYIKNFAVNIGAWITTAGQQRDGDQPLYDWQLDGVIDHVGGAWRDETSDLFRDVEGNTSPGSSCQIKWRDQPELRGWVDMHRVLAWMIDQGKWNGVATGAVPAPATPTGKATTATDGQLVLDTDGIPGPATISRFQQVMGTPIDGTIDDDDSTVIKAFQRFLNQNVAAGQIQDLTGKPALDEDGVAGEKTWKVFQFWAFNVRPDVVAHYAPGWGIWDFTDGVPGARTWKVLQHMLNESYANSGKLLAR